MKEQDFKEFIFIEKGNMRAQYNNSLGVFYGNEEDTVEQDILQALV